MILIVIFWIVAFPFVLIRDFIYRVILDRTVYTGFTFLKPRNDRERRIKAWIKRTRENKKRQKMIERQRLEDKRRMEENLALMEERWRKEKEWRGF
jgi:hypothetical protein